MNYGLIGIPSHLDKGVCSRVNDNSPLKEKVHNRLPGNVVTIPFILKADKRQYIQVKAILNA